MPYVCKKCGTGIPVAGSASAELKCGVCGSLFERREGPGWRWLAAQEWFVLIAAIVAGVTAFINS